MISFFAFASYWLSDYCSSWLLVMSLSTSIRVHSCAMIYWYCRWSLQSCYFSYCNSFSLVCSSEICRSCLSWKLSWVKSCYFKAFFYFFTLSSYCWHELSWVCKLIICTYKPLSPLWFSGISFRPQLTSVVNYIASSTRKQSICSLHSANFYSNSLISNFPSSTASTVSVC